jgi:CDP-glucose 4,6-dehydratase
MEIDRVVIQLLTQRLIKLAFAQSSRQGGRMVKWYGKRVLITGGDGFVASRLGNKLLGQNAYVVLTMRHYRSRPTAMLLDNPPAEKPDTELCDLSDLSQVRRLCSRHQIDTIFHLAASAIVTDAARDPYSTIVNNVMGTLNVLEAAAINEIPRVVVASSDKSYGDHSAVGDSERLPYVERHALRGLDAYSASKVCADMISQTYAFQYIVARCCNIYGPGDLNFTRLIPRTIMRLLFEIPPKINSGREDVKREYMYIDDVIEAYIKIASRIEDHYKQEKPKKGDKIYGWTAYNIGSYNVDTLKDALSDEKSQIQSTESLVKFIQNLMGTHMAPDRSERSEKNVIEIGDQYLNSERIQREVGFSPQFDLTEGLIRTIEWYKKHKTILARMGDRYINS